MEAEAQNKKSYYDQLLWNAVNQSLDTTIKAIGPVRFYRELEIYRALLINASHFCANRKDTFNDCYFKDNGCGIHCMQKFVDSDQYKEVTSTVALY
mmetsp:Transcript_15664/g.20097  ORF Transcript_15664/g.20097 Transcript_15664/m.20097 type:complete len:96 (-) Transcript_15664:636-923(-)